jgi:hypothetical protein
MELSLRPYMSAGVAVAGAGLIAVVPVGAHALDIQTRVVQLASVGDAPADVLSATAAPQEFPVSTLGRIHQRLRHLNRLAPSSLRTLLRFSPRSWTTS